MYQRGCTGIFWPAEGTTAGLSVFLKSEKSQAVLYGGKGPEYRLVHDFWPVPSAYWSRAQISNHRRACTQALLLYQKRLYTRTGGSLFYFSQIPGTGASLILNFFSNTRYQWFFDSDFFSECPQPVVLWFWFILSNAPNHWLLQQSKTSPPHWSIPGRTRAS